MGWQVIGFGNIDVESEKDMKEIISLMVGDKKGVIDKLLGDDFGDEFYEVKGRNGNISFKMDGNKGIDYGRLDRIKDYCKNNNISIEISVGEYTESDGGYYQNSSDVDE